MTTSVSYREEEKISEDTDADHENSKGRLKSAGSKRFQPQRYHSVPNFTEDEMDFAINTFFHEDEHTTKTWTRMLVENVFSKVGKSHYFYVLRLIDTVQRCW